MTIIDIPELCNAKPSDSRYKEFVLKFFDNLEKKYGIKFKMMQQNDSFSKHIRICVQRKNHKNYDTICLIPIRYKSIDSNGGYWDLGPFNWHVLFNRIFTYDGEGDFNFRFNCWIRNVFYATPRYKTFEEFKIAVDMDTVTFEPVHRPA